jgi:hypothetical protein
MEESAPGVRSTASVTPYKNGASEASEYHLTFRNLFSILASIQYDEQHDLC